MFSEKTDVPLLLIFFFSTSVILKIKSRSQKSDQFFVMSQLYIHVNLVKIQPLVHKILRRQESVTPTPKISTSKSIRPPPVVGGHSFAIKTIQKWDNSTIKSNFTHPKWFLSHSKFNINPSPAEPRYTLLLQTVFIVYCIFLLALVVSLGEHQWAEGLMSS